MTIKLYVDGLKALRRWWQAVDPFAVLCVVSMVFMLGILVIGILLDRR